MTWPLFINATTAAGLSFSKYTSPFSSSKDTRQKLYNNLLNYFKTCFVHPSSLDSSQTMDPNRRRAPQSPPSEKRQNKKQKTQENPPSPGIPGTSKDEESQNAKTVGALSLRGKYKPTQETKDSKVTTSEETQTSDVTSRIKITKKNDLCSSTSCSKPEYLKPNIKSNVHGPGNFPPPSEFVAYLELTSPRRKEVGGGSGGAAGGSGGATMGNQGIRQHVETSQKTGVFHLSKAKLHEFPPELAKIVNVLRNLDLSDNKIPSIPQNISAFVNLKHLNLNTNLIEVIPDQVGQLTKLETLSLANNRIKVIPATVGQLQKLRDVNLSGNALTEFPLLFCNLKFLTVLDLSKNRIPDVPDGVGGLQVVELILNQNQVRQLSQDLALCPNLKTLRLQENTLDLHGIPMQLLADSQVSLLSVEGNLFDVKNLSDLDGYERYMERYTSTKKKLT